MSDEQGSSEGRYKDTPAQVIEVQHKVTTGKSRPGLNHPPVNVAVKITTIRIATHPKGDACL